MTGSYPPEAKYDVEMMETTLLGVTADMHPIHLSKADLTLKIVSDPDDDREVGTLVQAIRNLREFGVFADRKDEIVQPTPPALHAVRLLT